MFIRNPQFPSRRWDFFPHAAAAPPQGDEQEDDTANDELFHDCPSLESPLLSQQGHAVFPPERNWQAEPLIHRPYWRDFRAVCPCPLSALAGLYDIRDLI